MTSTATDGFVSISTVLVCTCSNVSSDLINDSNGNVSYSDKTGYT